ncbi:hypothetical protein ACIG87_28830 [Micromonospora sp. NPDC051925]|uniref:hypothetical protein n=1 Tax=Micromonospora sp. NPDC051925 TaxID=3364288 RepID=UPI0037C66324
MDYESTQRNRVNFSSVFGGRLVVSAPKTLDLGFWLLKSERAGLATISNAQACRGFVGGGT